MSYFKWFILGLVVGVIANLLINNRIAAYKKSTTNRKPEYQVNDLILNRWSPRSLAGSVTKDQLMSLFEAARWAPSSYNLQPWAFVYGIRGSEGYKNIFDSLVPFNQSWNNNTPALVVALSLKEKDGKPVPTHSFDAGAAVQNLALQAEELGLSVHGMAGFDKEALRKSLQIPESYEIEAVYGIGYRGSKSSLPDELAEREVPSSRNDFKEFVFNGEFGKN